MDENIQLNAVNLCNKVAYSTQAFFFSQFFGLMFCAILRFQVSFSPTNLKGGKKFFQLLILHSM